MFLNQDNSEIRKFDQTNSRWWDELGPLKTLHVINPVRMAFINRTVDLTNKSVCDVGCGGGILTESLASKARNVIGIDLNASAIQTATTHAEANGLTNINYLISSTEDFANQHAASFDVVTCLEMLEHVPDPQSIIQACSELLKPGGLVFFATLNRTTSAYVKAVLTAEYVLNLLPKGTHDYAKFLKPSELAQSCREAGLELHSMTGLAYIPFVDRAYLSPQMDTNYILCANKPVV